MVYPLQIRIELNSRVELANLVHAASDEVCRLARLDEDAMLNMGLALREATINAIKHGNQMAEDKQIMVTFDLDAERLAISIQDEGSGFNFERKVDPRLPENVGKTNGRGLFLMKNFTDEVQFDYAPGKGTTVSLVKLLRPRARRRWP